MVKATELIEELAKFVRKHGDCNVMVSFANESYALLVVQGENNKTHRLFQAIPRAEKSND